MKNALTPTKCAGTIVLLVACSLAIAASSAVVPDSVSATPDVKTYGHQDDCITFEDWIDDDVIWNDHHHKAQGGLHPESYRPGEEWYIQDPEVNATAGSQGAHHVLLPEYTLDALDHIECGPGGTT